MKNIEDSKLLETVLKKYKNQEFLKVHVEEIIFYESLLFPEGPKYRILSAHPLK
jgi:2'-5' RNA ligase